MTDGELGGDGIARFLERPTAATAASTVEVALERGRVVAVVGECEVHVAGGERRPTGRCLAILKPDGSVVVHGHEGTTPVVELSGGDRPEASAVEGTLDLAAPSAEGVDHLRFGRVGLVSVATLDPAGGEPPGDDGLTAPADGVADRHGAIRERLLDDPDRVESGFTPLATERETPAGPVDLFGRDADGRAVVVEIKADRAGPAAVGQIDRYVAALRRDLHADAAVRGVLVAPSATERTRRLLEERGYAFRALPPE